jgi:DNA mismatch endonuclease, patch repair protein
VPPAEEAEEAPTKDRPQPSSSRVQRQMQRQSTRDTKPELALRKVLHASGMRYRLGFQPIAGLRRTPDILFTRQRVAVFVDGCFWHSCPEHGTMPKANAEWWASKLRRNVERDADTDRRLRDAGWTVVRIWEHEDSVAAATRVEAAVRWQRQSGGHAAGTRVAGALDPEPTSTVS